MNVSSFEDLALPTIDTATFDATTNVMVIIDEIGRKPFCSPSHSLALLITLSLTPGRALSQDVWSCTRADFATQCESCWTALEGTCLCSEASPARAMDTQSLSARN